MVKEEGIFKNALTDSTQTLTVHFIANKIFVFIESAMVKFSSDGIPPQIFSEPSISKKFTERLIMIYMEFHG